jgi:tetratricopeptide (TPR) repeat protein
MAPPDDKKWWILLTPTNEELVFENFEELKAAIDTPGSIEHLRKKSEPALKLSMPELANDLKSRPPPPMDAVVKDAPVDTAKDAVVKDAVVKDEAAAAAREALLKDLPPPSSSEHAPISLSDLGFAVQEVKMPSLPAGIARPSTAPSVSSAPRGASKPPPVPTRKSTMPPPLPAAAKMPSVKPQVMSPTGSTPPPASKPPPQNRSAAWEHDDASAPKIPTAASRPPPPLPKKSEAPPPPRPRPPPRPVEEVEEVEAELLPASRASAAALKPVAAPTTASSSRGWMIGAALIAAGTVAYLASSKPHADVTPTTASADPSTVLPAPSLEAMVADFDAAIVDGDLERAADLANKLTAAAEKDPRAVVRQAQVAVVKADRAWLAVRLAAANDEGAKRALDALSTKASELSDAAVAIAPDDTNAVLARIDALRIAGNLEAADALAARIEAKRAEPDVAYTRGALDFAAGQRQPGAAAAGLVDLQRAAAVSPKLARPQALLAYALAGRGELDRAREMAKSLDTPAHPNPLLEPLRAYIASRPLAASVVASANHMPSYVLAPTASVAPPPASVASPPGSAAVPPDEEEARPTPPATAPGLTALGDAARAKGDRGAAQTYYERALATNPGYLQAMLGLADIEWETGARSKATRRYQQIAEKFPNAPPRVRERLAQ